MKMLRTLRGRLVAAMLAILALALGTSALLEAPGAPALPRLLNAEPFQDALVLACFSVPALILIWLVSSWSLRPLARASLEARAVGPLDPSARISRAGLPAEITPLVDAVNGALDRMTEAFEAERLFTENAAHELRTPLCVLDLRLQQARQTAEAGNTHFDWPAIERDIAKMNRLVSQLLDLARRENASRAPSRAELPVVNLARIGREACAMMLPLVEAQNRTLTIDLPESLLVRGQADDLREVLCNLLENAVVHGKGAIGLMGDLASGSAETILVVSDDGGGPPAELEGVAFERFRKGGKSEGTGLGLAIVREVMRAHGGQAAFVPGVPCRMELRLPAA
jgi:two-component system sensor histidine kinase QseC